MAAGGATCTDQRTRAVDALRPRELHRELRGRAGQHAQQHNVAGFEVFSCFDLRAFVVGAASRGAAPKKSPAPRNHKGRLEPEDKVRDPAVGAGGGRILGSMSGGSKVPALSDGGGANDTTSVDPFDDFSEPGESSSLSLRARRHQTFSVRPLPYKKRPAAGGGGASRAAAGDLLSGTGSGGGDANGGVVVDRLLRNGGGDADGVAAAPAGAHRKCTRIATFMFKGGVYKTMNTVLTASALAAAPYNKRVLIVDADSQCNATSFFTPEPPDWQDDHKSPGAQESQGGEGGGVERGLWGGCSTQKARRRFRSRNRGSRVQGRTLWEPNSSSRILGSERMTARSSTPFLTLLSPNSTAEPGK